MAAAYRPDKALRQDQTADAAHDGLARELDARLAPGDLTALLALNDQWIWETDADHRFTYFSAGLTKHSGFRPDELLGRSRREIFFNSPVLSERASAHLDDLEYHRPFRDFVYETRERNGRANWLCISGLPRFDARGRFTGYLGVGRNLDDVSLDEGLLKAATAKVQQSERLMGELFNALSVGVLVFDANERFMTCNPHLLRMFPKMAPVFKPGTTMRAVIEHGFDIAAVDRARLGRALDRDAWVEARLKEYREIELDCVEHLADGRSVHQMTRRTSSGMFISIRTDVTGDFKRQRQLGKLAQDLDTANQRLNGAIDALPEGFAIWDRSNRLVSFNTAYRDLVASGIHLEAGQSYEAMVRDLAKTGDVEQARNREEEWVSECLAKRRDNKVIESIYRNRAGRWVLHRDVVAPNGERVDIRTDITELKAREAALEVAKIKALEAERAKSEFLANMSRQIRTPINGVIGMAEMLERSKLEPRERIFADIIRKSGITLVDMIDEILEFSEMEGGEIELREADFSLRDLIEDVMRLMAHRAADKGIDLRVGVDASIATEFIGDAKRIRQILSNLVSNAIQFTDDGQVAVTARRIDADHDVEKAMIELVVRDTGRGMESETRSALSENMLKQDAVTARVGSTGLGLAITSRLVRAMGGTCDIDSAPGEGTAITIRLALKPGLPLRMPALLSDALSGRRVMVLESCPLQSSALADPLRLAGVEVACVETVELAIALLVATDARGRGVDVLVFGGGKPVEKTLLSGLDRVEEHLSGPRPLLIDLASPAVFGTRAPNDVVAATLALPVRALEVAETVARVLKDRQDRASKTTPEPPSAIRQVDLLIAEDNPINQLVYTHILGATGLAYEIVSDGAAALSAFRERRPALLVLDRDMPEQDGLSVAKAIRALPEDEGGSVPIIAVDLEGHDAEWRAAGADDIVHKPIRPETLLAAIEGALGALPARKDAV